MCQAQVPHLQRVCRGILYLFYLYKCVVLCMNIGQTNPLSSMPHSSRIHLFQGIFHCWKHLLNSVMGLCKSCCVVLIVHCSSAASIMISILSALTKSCTSAITISFLLHKGRPDLRSLSAQTKGYAPIFTVANPLNNLRTSHGLL